MATSRYANFKTVRVSSRGPRTLETFPSIRMEDLNSVPHTVIKFKESDRLDHLSETFLGHATYWWAICLMNDLNNPFSYKLLPGKLLKIPNNIEPLLAMIKQERNR